jgi:tRNA threonylcarbamoyladenosine biosynthesis protein TsaB
MLTLAFDTATDVATSGLVRDGEALAERASKAVRVLLDVDDMLREAGLAAPDLDRIAVGTGPGSFTGLRMGLATARALAFSLGLPVAGVSTLDALAAGSPGALPVVDARRSEVFTVLPDGPAAVAPQAVDLDAGTRCVGDGAVRYRELLEAKGAEIPPDDDEAHMPRARFHALLAHDFGPAELVEPLYLRVPDAVAAVEATR